MGLLKWWRARGYRGPDAGAGRQESPPIAPFSVAELIASIEKSTLERMKLEAELRIEELKCTAEERREEREYQRKSKEKARESRVKNMEQIRKKRATLRGEREAGECFVCAHPTSIDLTPALIAEHRKHAPLE